MSILWETGLGSNIVLILGIIGIFIAARRADK